MLGAMNRNDQIHTLLRQPRRIERGRERGLGIER